MKYLFFICLCLGLYGIFSHYLKMKVTLSTDCTTYKNQNTCVANKNCEWNTKCQPMIVIDPVPSKKFGGTKNTVSSTSSKTPPKMQSASTIK